ncbi:MAG: cell division protein ZapA [Rickettsia endosymbiont of Bryobia graminum]|nr:cell division protein ZapA [Rickettsia endosymbiont of Bryobia graminum]
MSIVTITLGSKNFQLACSNGSVQELNTLVVKLNDKIAEMKKISPTASFELLLVMAALGLQEKVQNLTNQITDFHEGKTLKEEEQFAETLSTIAGYLENLAKKIGK